MLLIIIYLLILIILNLYMIIIINIRYKYNNILDIILYKIYIIYFDNEDILLIIYYIVD